jgi:cysteine desulfurase
MKKEIYLDHNATTPIDPEVVDAMLPYLRECFGNASSVHGWGQEARYGVEKARLQLAALVSCPEENLVFTSCGTESNNTVLRSVARRFQGEGCHIVSSSIEHPAVYRCLEAMKTEGLADYTLVDPEPCGSLDPQAVAAALRPETRLVSLMLANNEMGAIQPVAEVVDLAHSRNIEVHSDTVQALGKVPLDLTNVGLDYATFSAHKIYGPKGIGGIYARDRSKLTPLLQGGGQEGKLRPGTESVPMIVAFGAAADLCRRNLEKESAALSSMRNRLQYSLQAEIPSVSVCAEDTDRLPGTLCVCFTGIYGTYAVLELAEEGIAVSSGSACSANKSEPSHVLLAMGIDPEVAQGAVRFSLGRANRPEQIPTVVEKTKRIVERLRSHPPQQEQEFDLLSICD